MFQNARIKLTAWYLLIIMLVSMSFSVVIYRVLTTELDRLERVQRIRIERRLPQIRIVPRAGVPEAFFDPDVVAETKQRIIFMLMAINAAILAGSAIAGYFLAGRTLTPIADMIEEQNRFITDASHELRTPLTSLKSEIEVNLRKKDLTFDEAKRLLQSNLEEVNNLQTLSDGLMKLSQFQKEKNGLEVSNLYLASVVKEAIRRVSTAAKGKRITITSTVSDLTLSGNSMLLTELFIILLDNSIKYSPKGKNIRITGKKTDAHVMVQVIDRGYGIHKEDVPHLYDRFWRVDKSRTKTTTPGYGLGLAIAKQIVQRHQGSINVESTVNRGTTFTLMLPINMPIG